MATYSNEDEERTRNDFYREESYLRAQKKVKKIIGFYWHLASYIIINLFLILFLGTQTGDFWSFGVFSTPIFWGIGLLFHFAGVFGADLLFGKNWEQRKIKEYMDKDKKRWE